MNVQRRHCGAMGPPDRWMRKTIRSTIGSLLCSFSCLMMPTLSAYAADEVQSPRDRAVEVQQGSQIAKGGFQNEDEIRDKFNNWKTDKDARAWLLAMKYSLEDAIEVTASKPHGEKADVEVRVRAKGGERVEGISIKLVSNPNGFNQIDKRWLANYAKMWSMPADVHEALKLFVGETPPVTGSRGDERMFLNELDEKTQHAVVEFFTQHREQMVSDLFRGDGDHAADWMMVTLKDGGRVRELKGPRKDSSDSDRPQWILRSTGDVIRFYGEGEVRITSAGSLRIGRITMQRKGGDNGRESAKMLQFKINPAELFDIADVQANVHGRAEISH